MLIGKVKCKLCGRDFKAISHTHLMKDHGISQRQYMDMFPEAPLFDQCVKGNPNDARELLLDGQQQSDSRAMLLDALRKNWNSQKS